MADVGHRSPAPAWRATYRLQLTSTFGFDDARSVLPYLRDLGVSHLYLSPSLEAVAGSDHGYDGTDPTRVSAERGGEAALRRLAEGAHAMGLGVLLDIVPNHLAAHDETPWWRDPAERAQVFDIDRADGWYRRFFDIDGLVGVRQEDPEVFERTHAKILDLVAGGVVDGLRVDHPDGLTDPAGYLRRLRDRAGVPVWVEKILARGEALRPWPVAGTVGYEFADEVGALFVPPDAEPLLDQVYAELTGDTKRFEEVAAAAKAEQLDGPFRRELDRLALLAPDVDRADLAAAVVGLPVYRTYVEPRSGHIDPADRALLEGTGASAELVGRLLLDRPAPPELVERYQQLTAPVAAKGVEDTAFYRSIRLLARNEVGGEPGTLSLPVAAFHEACRARAAAHPTGLLAGTTHDTKRSADTRARITALTWDVADSAEHLARWFAITENLVGPEGPSDLERWYVFQTLIGSWPITADRLGEHLRKAAREAGLRTDWIHPDRAHEDALLSFAVGLLDHPGFLADFLPVAARTAMLGERISVAQTLLRATTPGVCDTYQGDETWFLSLVDPDVRRTQTWEGRRRQLERVRAGAPPTRGTAKLHVLHHALDLRRRRPAPFADRYEPLEAGSATVAFLRGDEVLVVVPVRGDETAELTPPAGTWTDELTRRTRQFQGPQTVASLVGPLGVGLWSRPAM